MRFLLALALLIAPACPSPAEAAGRAVTIASLLGEDKPETRVWTHIRDALQARLPGRFDLRVVANAALGGERQVNEGARLGSVQGALSTLAALSPWVPEGQVMDLPFLFRDRPHIAQVLEGPIGKDLAARLEARGFHVLGWTVYGARHLMAKAPLDAPEALAAKRIRVIESPLHAELWRAFGANPTPLPLPETYGALQTGVVDLMDLTVPPYVALKLNEVVPVVTETGHIWSVGAIYLSGPFWRSLKPEEQAAFTEAGREGAAAFEAMMVEEERTSRERARAAGVRFVPVADPQGWRTRAAPVRDAFAERLGMAERVRAIAAAP